MTQLANGFADCSLISLKIRCRCSYYAHEVGVCVCVCHNTANAQLTANQLASEGAPSAELNASKLTW